MRIIPLLLGLTLPAAAGLAETNQEMAAKAGAFLDSLTPAQAKKARYEFKDAERENWHFIPKVRGGVPLKQLDEAQKSPAMALLASGLSQAGLVKAEAIIAMEAILGAIENSSHRDSGLYYFAVFGSPGPDDPWGWRVEGHHLSVNFTLAGNKITATPSFMGVNPAEVREGDHKGLRPLAKEEDLARSLAASLAEAKRAVLFSAEAPRDILSGTERSAKQLDPVGVAAADMTELQQQGLILLVNEYVNRHRQDVAAKDLVRIRKQGTKQIRFGWAGGLKPGEAYYYRIHGPGFLIEAANTQNNANHIHTVWRDLKGDFGQDVLARHYQAHE